MESKTITVVRDFVAAINRGSAEDLAKLMTDDHTFVNSAGESESGLEKMTKGWEEYFRSFPDFRVEIQNILEDGNLVAAFGSASGTYNGKRGLVPENRIEMPAAWRAIVEMGKIKVWQVYADWTEGWKIINEDTDKGKSWRN